MAYPKPLSEKTLLKKYADAKINDEKKQFLHTFFLAASKLYGSIELNELWTVYKELAQKTPVVKMTKKDLVAFSEIVRREKVPYYVFEIDEIYCEEKRKDLERCLVTKDMVHGGYGKFHALWNLHELQLRKEPYVPSDLLKYAEDIMTKEQKNLLTFLGNLKVTATEYTDRWGETYPCEHVGELLKNFEFLDANDRFEIKYLSGEFKDGPKRNEKKLAAFLEECKGPIADRIYKDYMWRIKSGWVEPQKAMEMLFEDIEEVGVLLSENELKEFINLINATQNCTNLWNNMGWTPMELTRKMYAEGHRPLAISFGPEIEKAIGEGKINKEDLIRMFEEKGLKVIK